MKKGEKPQQLTKKKKERKKAKQEHKHKNTKTYLKIKTEIIKIKATLKYKLMSALMEDLYLWKSMAMAVEKRQANSNQSWS